MIYNSGLWWSAVFCKVYLIVMRKHIYSQGLFTFIYEFDSFICILYRHYWKNWSKNFFLHHLGFRINVSKYCWGWKGYNKMKMLQKTEMQNSHFYICFIPSPIHPFQSHPNSIYWKSSEYVDELCKVNNYFQAHASGAPHANRGKDIYLGISYSYLTLFIAIFISTFIIGGYVYSFLGA